MKRFRSLRLNGIILGLLLFTFHNANGEITAVCNSLIPCSTPRAITSGQNVTLQLTWRGRARAPEAGDIISPYGSIIVGANSDDSVVVDVSLRQSLAATAEDETVDFTVSESLTIPGELSRQAAALGLQQLTYARAFTLEGITVNATQVITLKQSVSGAGSSIAVGTDPGATGITLSRIALAFDNGSLIETTSLNASLHATATLTFEGAGMVDAVWEFAKETGAVSSSSLLFQPLANVRQYLGAGRQVTLQSPPLPTTQLGVFVLRLRVRRPELDLSDADRDSLKVRYQVASNSLTAASQQVLTVMQPAHNVALQPDTAFSWIAQSGARAYRIEIYDRDVNFSSENPLSGTTQPITGLLLDATQTSSILSASVFSRLQPGTLYYWRVVAISTEGATMASSRMREIRMLKSF